MFEIHVRPVAECAIEGLLHEGAVVRMNALETRSKVGLVARSKPTIR